MSNDAAAWRDPLLGQIIQGRYRVVGELGRGGMGKVYLAEQLSIGRRVALKVLLERHAQNLEVLTRFRREAQLAAALDNHPRVVSIYDCDEMEDGSFFIVMEYVQGRTLREVVGGPLPIKRAVSLALQIAEGLHTVHRAGIIHRDVKPQNIMVRQTEEGEVVKLMDFGIARPLDSHTPLTHVGFVVGTAAYMAPEITQHGQYSQQSDLYAWGIVLYEMLAGKPPFAAATPEALAHKHWHETPVPLRNVRPEVPGEIEQIIAQTLAKNPEQRPKTMREVITRLRAAESKIVEEVTAPTVHLFPPGNEEEEKPGRWERLKWVTILLSTAVAGVLILWVVNAGRVQSFLRGRSTGLEEQKPEVPQPAAPPQEAAQGKSAPPAGGDHAIADHLNIGQLYLKRGDYTEAIAEFEAAKDLAPDKKEIRDFIERAQHAREAEKALGLAR